MINDNLESIKATLNDWTNMSLILKGDVDYDKKKLFEYCHNGEKLLADLPSKKQRNTEQQCIADCIFQHCREIRQQFIGLHIDWIKNKLLIPIENHQSMSEIAFRAAELVPGLLPTKNDIDRELSLLQADKEGLEIDQGIFFSGLLNDYQAGKLLIENMLKPTARALNLLPKFNTQMKLNLGKISIEIIEKSAYITFLNSDCLNAEDNQLIKDFETAVDLALLSKKVDVGVLRGGVVSHPRYKNKRVFSAGINLKHIDQGQISFTDFILGRELGYINKMLRGIKKRVSTLGLNNHYIEKPWIAAVDTFAIGGGMQLLFACDYVVATEDSYVSLPAAKEGIVPGVSNLRLSKAASGRLAQQVILHGRKIFAMENDAGFVFDKVVNPQDMDKEIRLAVKTMSSPAVIANRKMLRISQEPTELFQAYMAEFSLEQAKRLYSNDVLNKVDRF